MALSQGQDPERWVRRQGRTMLIVPREAPRDVDPVSGVLDRLMILEGGVVPAMGAERLQVCIECARRESLGVWLWRLTEDWEDASYVPLDGRGDAWIGRPARGGVARCLHGPVRRLAVRRVSPPV